MLLAGRAADRLGPRIPMLATLLTGAVALAAAAAAPDAGSFVGLAAVAFAAYWAYLPVVSVQVQRSATPEARGRAVGGLYASMWLGAAVAGTGASLMGDWRPAVAGRRGLWALAAVITARGFLGEAASSAAWPILAQPPASPRSTR